MFVFFEEKQQLLQMHGNYDYDDADDYDDDDAGDDDDDGDDDDCVYCNLDKTLDMSKNTLSKSWCSGEP